MGAADVNKAGASSLFAPGTASSCVDLFAPGMCIRSLSQTESKPKNAAVPAAYVAGASALLLARWPGLGPPHVKEILIESGKPGEPAVSRMGDAKPTVHHDSFLNITKALKFAAEV